MNKVNARAWAAAYRMCRDAPERVACKAPGRAQKADATSAAARVAAVAVAAAASLVTAHPVAAQEPRCSVEQTKRELAGASSRLAPAVWDALGSVFSVSPDRCASIRTVMTLASGSRRTAGRGLVAMSALDLAAAREERAQAMAKPEFAQLLQRETAAESDPLRRALIEAALLHDAGHYAARDLILEGLRKGEAP
jgi:hypothetical protein